MRQLTPVVKWLLIANIAVFILDMISAHFGYEPLPR